MKIAFVSTFRCECGIATYTEALGHALASRGHDVNVLAMELDDHALYFGRGGTLPYLRCWTRSGDLDHLRNMIVTMRPDIVHVQHEYGLFTSIPKFVSWLDECAPNTAVTCHTIPIPGHQQESELKWLMDVVAKNHFTAIAHQEGGEKALRSYGVKRARFIPHGTHVGITCTARLEARRRLSLPEDAVVGATLGFWTRGKRNDVTIQALCRLHQRQRLPHGFVFVIAGQPMGHDSISDMREWCARLERLGLSEVIRLRPGFVDDAMLADYYGASDFVVANSGPTLYSISGRGHLAMSYGAAVLAANVPLLSEFRHCGLTFSSLAQLEDGIERLSRDAELRALLRERARDYARKTSWDRSAELHEQVYQEILANDRCS